MALRKILILLLWCSIALVARGQDENQKPAEPQPSPETTASPSPQPSSQGDSAASDSTKLVVIQAPRPVYPPAAANKSLQGQVLIGLLINETGDVESTEIISGDPDLAKAAADAMKKWKFKPYIKDGKPVKVKTKLPFDFAFKANIRDYPANGTTASADGNSRLRISKEVAEGYLLHRVEPIYPPVARVAHIQGEVILWAAIGTDGRIHNLKAISGNPVLVEASMGAVQQWRYRPYMVEGKPVEVETSIKVMFRVR